MKVTKTEVSLLKQIEEELDVATDFIAKMDSSSLICGVSKIETVRRLIISMTNEAEIIE